MCIRDPSQRQRGEGLVYRSGQTIRRPGIESQLWLWRRGRESVRQRVRVAGNLRRTFFMMPAFLLENVMWRRDLSVMNLISIFLRSRPGLSSSSSSSSAVEGRWRLIPRLSPPAIELPFPTVCSSRADGEPWSCWSVMSAIVVRMYDENNSFELRADDLTAYGEWERLLSCFCRRYLVAQTGLRMAWMARTERFSLQKLELGRIRLEAFPTG